ncbi:MAG: hypothetical protein LAQ69_15250 [Acidobacteriia bacterium]|nr:hypothetical protein [Terriglobia bacterium]
MKTATLILAAALFAFAQQSQVLSVSGNFPRDLYGPVDLRGDCCWGHADYATLPITFPARVGYRVHILRLRGDLIAWPKVLEGQEPIKPGAYAGVLAGFASWDVDTQAGPNRRWTCDFCATAVPLYIQAGLSVQPIRAPFDYDLRGDDVFLDNGVLYLKIAAFLNTTGYPIHVEATYTLTARYEKVE